MTPDTLRVVLRHLNSRAASRQSRQQWLVATCPFAPFKHKSGVDRNPSFGVSLSLPHRYHCFSCNESGPLDELPYALKRFAPGSDYSLGAALQLIASDVDVAAVEIEDWGARTGHEVVTWPEWHLNSFVPANHARESREYLLTRGIGFDHVSRLDLRFDSNQKRVLFPIRDFDGKLVGLHGRTIRDREPKYLAYSYQGRYNPVCWYGEQWVDFDEPVLMVESVFDYMAVLPLYCNVVAPLYAGLNREKVYRMSGAFNVVTLFDNDEAGSEARQTIERLHPSRLQTHLVPVGAKDPGEMTQTALIGLLGKHLNLLEKDDGKLAEAR